MPSRHCFMVMARVNAALLWNQLQGSCQLRLARLAHPQVAHVSHQPAKSSLTFGNPQHLNAEKEIREGLHGLPLGNSLKEAPLLTRHVFLQVQVVQ